MKKDWRYYQHCGSKGNVWADLHMTPEERRHLVVTPTVIRGYDQQMRTVAKHLKSEQETSATRMERIVYERHMRRFRLLEQQRNREMLEARSSQRPLSSQYMSEYAESDAGGSRPKTAATSSRPITANTAHSDMSLSSALQQQQQE